MFWRISCNFFRNSNTGFKDYCTNSSLTGLSYIVNDKLHFSERIFWCICFAVSCFFSYDFINNYRKSFSENAISLVIEAVRPFEIIKFPSVAVCETGVSTENFETEIVNILNKEFSANGTLRDRKNIQSFFHGLTYAGSYIALDNCAKAEKSTDPVMKCPKSGLKEYAKRIQLPCELLILDCKWKGNTFNCCNYFLPLTTSLGNCFMLNSIQTTERNGAHWLNVDIRRKDKLNQMEIIFNTTVSVTIGSDDDIPHMLLKRLTYSFILNEYKAFLGFNLIDMVNDDEIEKINYIDRKCKLPEEVNDGLYKFHSFSACTTNCIRNEQLRLCNCSFYTFSTKAEHEANECDLNGLRCLLKTGVYVPERKFLQPWRSDGLKCTCLPSCNEKQIKITELHSVETAEDINRTIILKLQAFPAKKFRRQSVRGNLEVVVTIGGLLGLFLGASILSGIEFLYFVIRRILKIF